MAKEDKNPWFGKAVGGLLGLAFGGPIGGLIGLWIGSKFDKKRKRRAVTMRYTGQNETVAAAVAAAVTALGAKLSKSDGQITTLEILAFRRIFNVAQDDVARIGVLWRSAGDTVAGYEPYARHLSQLFKTQPKMLSRIMANLKTVAEADGAVTQAERWILDDIAEIFGLGPNWEVDAAIEGVRGNSITLSAQNVEHAFREIFASGGDGDRPGQIGPTPIGRGCRRLVRHHPRRRLRSAVRPADRPSGAGGQGVQRDRAPYDHRRRDRGPDAVGHHLQRWPRVGSHRGRAGHRS